MERDRYQRLVRKLIYLSHNTLKNSKESLDKGFFLKKHEIKGIKLLPTLMGLAQ